MRYYYQFGLHDFGNGGEIFLVTGPKGKKGKVIDYGIHHCTETFTATTLPAYVSVGTAADADAYGEELSMATFAADAGSRSVMTVVNSPAERDTYMLAASLSLPADTAVGLHVTAPTGGTPAGMAQPFMIIDWED